MAKYAHPEVLVTTDWVKENLDKPGIKLVEIDVDTKAYEAGHIPGAVGFNWQTQLQDQVRRDIIGKEAFEKLVGGAGISSKDSVILYGDNNNWFAAYGFWLFKIYGHKPVDYRTAGAHFELRAMLPEVMEISRTGKSNLVDVRSPDEFTGKVIAPPGMSETAQRGGHIPGAKSVPWSTAVQQDGTFKSADELQGIYVQQKGVDPKKPTVAYCRIGERSSHTWFVLNFLLGLENVKNYDGSWTEYGNVVAAPIEKG